MKSTSRLILMLGCSPTDTQLGSVPTDPNLDSDHDLLTNQEEAALGTNPWMPDTDRDGFEDGVERHGNYDPNDPPSTRE